MVEPVGPQGADYVNVSDDSLSGEDNKISIVAGEVFSESSVERTALSVSSLESRVSQFIETKKLNSDQLALPSGQGLGYKSTGLIEMKELADACGAEVPPFLALSHHELLAHILLHYPDFKKDYASFVASMGNPPVLTEAGLALLAKIQSELRGAFSKSPLFETPALKDWIESVGSDFIAVRSTGKEDSTTNSNAGGNLSNPFVQKVRDEILINIGEVIASYFDKRSITQRIASEDPSLVEDKEPFVPVLLQWAVAEPIEGETPDGQVPISGVMFIKNLVSEISVGLGHNEGVVTSQVRTDSYRFIDEGEIIGVIQNKSTRFRGKRDEEGNVVCEAVSCKKTLAEAPALKPEIAKKLQMIANAIYKLKKMEMDVEFTIVGDKIYLLQARPLNTPKPEEEPSYLDGSVDQIQCESLTEGGVICKSDRIIRKCNCMQNDSRCLCKI